MIQDTVDNPSGSPSDQARLIAEGWADFYTAQVVGGTNYFAPLGTRRSENVAYCDQSRFDSTQPCTEDNIGGPIGTFPNARSTLGDPSDRAIGRFTTLMVDAFDSASTVPDRSVLNAGARWQFIAPTTPSGGVAGVGIPTLGGGLDDESATLAGSDLTSIIRAWSDRADRLRFNSFYDAIASVITLRHDESTACNVFALHEPTNDCTRLAPILGESADKSLPAPFGLRVTSTLNATASTPVVSASWALAAPGATHAYVEVYHGPLMLEGITLPYALSGTWTSTTNLPFDAPLTVRVAASLGVSANSAYLSGTVRTPSEPVHIATATADWRSANVSWTQTAATSYAVRTTAVVSGVTTWTATGNTNSINIGSLQPDTQYRFEVFSVNASGETCPVSSPSTFATPYEIIIE